MKWLVFVLLLINAVRLRGVLRLSAALGGKLPPVHAALGLGDMLIGFTALGLGLAVMLRPWNIPMIRIVRIWSIAAALDLTLAISVESMSPTLIPGFHDITGMMTILATNVITAGMTLSARRT